MRQDEATRTQEGVEQTLLMLETLVLEEDEGKLAASCSEILSSDKGLDGAAKSAAKQDRDLEANHSSTFSSNSEESLEKQNSISSAEIFQDEIDANPAPTATMLQRLGLTPKMQLLTSITNKSRQRTASFADDAPPPTDAPPLTDLTRRESVPGAHRISNGSDTQAAASTAIECWNNDVTDSTASEQWAQGSASSGLVEAKPVLEDLPRAVGMNHHKAKSTPIPGKQCLGIVMGIMLIAVVVTCSLIAFLAQRENTDAPLKVAIPTFHTQAPTSLEGRLLSLLSESTIYYIEEQGSPQARAFDWLMQDLQYTPNYLDDRIKQRFALATLYYATGGKTWFQNKDWLRHDHNECKWFQQSNFASKSHLSHLYPGYLSEFFPTGLTTPRCNSNGEVVHLWLDTNNLVGSLPLELYMLTSLETMSFGFNPGLSGSIASEIGRLSSLEALINFNLVQGGTIPSQIGLLTGLKGLGLYNNGHTGQIPTEIWQLTNLSSLLLGGGHNVLKGSIPTEFGLFSNMRWLHIMETFLTGSIPSEISKLTKLEWCVLEQNQLSGLLPTELGELTGLSTLSLWMNSLTGTLPSQLGQLTSMELLTVRMNQMTGSIPTQLGLLTNMEELLDLGQNPFQGEIPTQIGLLTNLEEFNANGALNLTGAIPSELGLLTSLQWLGLANTSLMGSVPNQLSSLKDSLYLMELNDSPGLSGTIPSKLCVLSNVCIESSIKPCETARKGLIFDCTDRLGGCNCTAPQLDQLQDQHHTQTQDTQHQAGAQAMTPCLGMNSTSILLCEDTMQPP